MKRQVHKHLTPEERAEAMKLGAFLRLAELGVRPSRVDQFAKQAGVTDLPRQVAGLVMATSLLTGIPAGIVAHHVGQSTRRKRMQERETEEKIKYYQNAASNLETGLAGAGG